MTMMNAITRFFVSRVSERRLSQLDSHLLCDVGLTRSDIYDTRFMGAERRAAHLQARRERRARIEIG
ncbi:MAG TPA: DUF1127 domain-containing protein [Devosia sp.]|nr:DUF1127 domain-containing protein [Devosia sp.]